MQKILETIERIKTDLAILESQVTFFKKCSNPECDKSYRSIDDFYLHRYNKDGLSSWCKDCTRRASRNRRKI